jgi:hypothetical protein
VIRTCFAVAIPLYPFFWMIWEMISQKISLGKQ